MLLSTNYLKTYCLKRSTRHGYHSNINFYLNGKENIFTKKYIPKIENSDKMYTTSHQRDFKNIPENRSNPLRPQTTEFASQRPYHVDDSLPVTTNKDFHGAKEYSKAGQIRSGTASGTRCNNPHPNEMFMTWRVPRDLRNTNTESIDNQHVDKIIRDQFNSVYSKSYNGLPQGFNPLGGLETSEPTVIQTRNTETRENYLVKVVEDPIKEPITRYGSNKDKHLSAIGSVPGFRPLELTHQTQGTINNTSMYKTQFCGMDETKTLTT